MDEAIKQLLRVVIQLEQCDEGVRSLFQVATESDLPYGYGWRCLQEAERRELVTVGRNGPGVPLAIVSTDTGKAYIKQSDGATKWQETPI